MNRVKDPCHMRTRLVKPFGVPKPHRYTVRVSQGDQPTEIRCPGCYRLLRFGACSPSGSGTPTQTSSLPQGGGGGRAAGTAPPG